jgi:membrane protein YdbS with pleckstrin-like domain
MGISPKLLGEGEHVIVATREHWKAIIFPIFMLIVTAAVTGFLLAVLPDGSAGDILMWLVLAAAVVVLVWFVLRPLVLWLSSSYTVTNRRLINRTGIITRRGVDIPLFRINDVRYEKGPIDRLLGCGTLIISASSDFGVSTLRDVPDVEQLQLTITELLFGTDDGADDDGTPFRGPAPRPQ